MSVLPIRDQTSPNPLLFTGSSNIGFTSAGGDSINFVPNDGPGNFLSRLKTLIPPWFGNGSSPILDAVLSGPASILSFLYNLVQYVSLQARLATETDGFLDLFAYDFFGGLLPRQFSELDVAYRARVKGAFWPTRNTRPALTAALMALGVSVVVFEPWNPGDTGALNNATTLAWNTAGLWGSRTSPFQCFVTVTIPAGSSVTNSQIYAAIEAIRPVAIKVWVQIIG